MNKLAGFYILFLFLACAWSGVNYFPLNKGDWWKYEYWHRYGTSNCPYYADSGGCWRISFGSLLKTVDSVAPDSVRLRNIVSIDSMYRHPQDYFHLFDDTIRYSPALKETSFTAYRIQGENFACRNMEVGDVGIMRNNLSMGDSIWVDSLFCEGYFRFDSVVPVVLPDTIVHAIRGRDFVWSSDTAFYWFAENIGMVQCETNISAFCTGHIPEDGWTARLKLLSSNLLGQSDAEKAKGGQIAALCAYPNPFNPETRILYGGSESADLKIFSINGKLVKAGFFNGRDGFVWDGRDGRGRPMPAGVYIARVTAGNQKAEIRLLLAR